MTAPERVNLFELELEVDDDDPPGYNAHYRRIGPMLGAAVLGATIYQLPPGQSNCPYHYELRDEEWLLVLDGTLTVRHPEGESELRAGDVACFRDGPEGAHKLTNRSDGPVRLVMLSTKREPSVSFYPDSAKIGVWPGGKVFREVDAVDYWEGEI